MNDTAVAALSEAADANFVTHAGWLQQRTSGMRVQETPELAIIDSGLRCDTFNFICRARLAPGARDVIRAALGYFERVRRPFSWWVGPADRPSNLGDLLVESGLERAETELAMSLALADLPAGLPATPGLRIARVTNDAMLADFARLSAAHWTPPDENVVRFYQLTSSTLLAPDCPLQLYLGYCDDEVVATSELTVGGGVAGLYNISTRAPYRRRGLGSALTLAPLLAARALGLRHAVLQAAPAGVGMYQRIGFRAFGQITEYKPVP